MPERFIFCAKPNLSHIVGKSVTRPKIISRPPENTCQKLCGTAIKSVDALRRSVKRKTDVPSEVAITSARLTLLSPDTEPPIITGKSGRVQGASTVSKPATKAMSKSVMPIVYVHTLEM